MIDSMPPAELAEAERFERFGLDADPHVVARTRQEFALWLQRSFALDAVRCSDLVLAINEALANAAEFAYRLADHPGTIDLLATYQPAEQKLMVDICDQGTWRPRQIDPAPRTRGRGIPLMEALSDRATIETSADGTQVRLEWNGIHQI
ncbi:anti-sigma regulatory factor [Mycolicibacterium cyprinidarum]|uniref:Anti-sigma regulatory factor n=1 Tax=Mycolicibacterium cyprinidarum TaxID=2860311 RepID=A0ABQ4V3W3_9MYCO|nr:anti-sigma regulatory factor [Mycolicibacterium sp. NGTWSNA01]GJF14613.1 anti-sigma regulatory factor [Mycolicibacterium sp. NGTWS0302]GJF16108.1 anti-sigma regulatory factor [Mycolicibacterium sp. NGTWS1803]